MSIWFSNTPSEYTHTNDTRTEIQALAHKLPQAQRGNFSKFSQALLQCLMAILNCNICLSFPLEDHTCWVHLLVLSALTLLQSPFGFMVRQQRDGVLGGRMRLGCSLYTLRSKQSFTWAISAIIETFQPDNNRIIIQQEQQWQISLK